MICCKGVSHTQRRRLWTLSVYLGIIVFPAFSAYAPPKKTFEQFSSLFKKSPSRTESTQALCPLTDELGQTGPCTSTLTLAEDVAQASENTSSVATQTESPDGTSPHADEMERLKNEVEEWKKLARNRKQIIIKQRLPETPRCKDMSELFPQILERIFLPLTTGHLEIAFAVCENWRNVIKKNPQLFEKVRPRNIHDLPKNTFVEDFMYLKGSDLKAAAYTCYSWSEAIKGHSFLPWGTQIINFEENDPCLELDLPVVLTIRGVAHATQAQVDHLKGQKNLRRLVHIICDAEQGGQKGEILPTVLKLLAEAKVPCSLLNVNSISEALKTLSLDQKQSLTACLKSLSISGGALTHLYDKEGLTLEKSTLESLKLLRGSKACSESSEKKVMQAVIHKSLHTLSYPLHSAQSSFYFGLINKSGTTHKTEQLKSGLLDKLPNLTSLTLTFGEVAQPVPELSLQLKHVGLCDNMGIDVWNAAARLLKESSVLEDLDLTGCKPYNVITNQFYSFQEALNGIKNPTIKTLCLANTLSTEAPKVLIFFIKQVVEKASELERIDLSNNDFSKKNYDDIRKLLEHRKIKIIGLPKADQVFQSGRFDKIPPTL